MRRGSHAVPGLPDDADSFTDPAGLLHDLDGGLSGEKDCDSSDWGQRNLPHGLAGGENALRKKASLYGSRGFVGGGGVLVMSVHKNVVVL